jgi:hypothetical protein
MLFCITANYTPKALEATGKNPKTNRRETPAIAGVAASSDGVTNVKYQRLLPGTKCAPSGKKG